MWHDGHCRNTREARLTCWRRQMLAGKFGMFAKRKLRVFAVNLRVAHFLERFIRSPLDAGEHSQQRSATKSSSMVKMVPVVVAEIDGD